ncbi:MAG: hypothetical protein J6A77_07265 [Lachnospiraceae bacterium]|nr:hypothetical protein [Lachnospiraceae bacterium]
MKEIHIRNLTAENERRSIVSVVCGYESEVTAVVNGQKLNAKSIMNTPMIDHAESIDFTVSGNIFRFGYIFCYCGSNVFFKRKETWWSESHGNEYDG